MKLKKITTTFLAAAFLSMAVIAPVGAELTAPTPPALEEVMPIEKQSRYMMATGVVKEIQPYHADKSAQFISVEGKNGEPTNLIVSANTYVVDNAELTEGTQVIYFYDATKPMILIYPAQINADVVAVIDDSRMIKVDVFNDELVSQDNFLKLNIAEDTVIVNADGSAYTGELANHKLVVIYDVSTKSIPAQTTPKKVIVLGVNELKGEDLYDENYRPDVTKMNIVVGDGIVIDAPKAFTNENGVVMVPLRVITEALGHKVGWDGETYSITIGENVALKINAATYTTADKSSVTLDAAPTLVNDITYVPLNFFTKVLMLNNAYVFEGQIDVNNGEKME